MKEFYAKRYDINKNKVIDFNIFNNIRFDDCINRLNKKKNLSDKEYLEEVRSALMYSFWSKVEYELSIGDAFEEDLRKYEKIDVFQQCEPNLKLIAEICKIKKRNKKPIAD